MIASLQRINELARKERETGLTNAEWVEQQVLREDYLREIRGQVLSTFSGLKIVDPEGADVTPEKVRQAKKDSSGNGDAGLIH
ncbi:DUF896 domain-containing protein [Paenibacillus sp. NPDC058071]|uniref:DUF896 domain-containing protein n=1 Tax=Paenibacillus sp. NPDC058071 TaxID=3346326 RepID=UPI0036D7C662